MSTQMVNLYDALSETFGKDRAHLAIKDIEDYLNDHKRELATKADLRETELKLMKEIEVAKSSTIKWVVGWVAGLLIAYTAAIYTMITILK